MKHIILNDTDEDKELVSKIKDYQKAHGLSSFVSAVRKLCKDALEIEKINYATKVMDERHQTVERGRDAANQDAVKNAKNRSDDFSKGYNQQSAKLVQEMQKREAGKKKSGVSIKQSAPAAKRKAAQSQAGTFSGDNNVDDDF